MLSRARSLLSAVMLVVLGLTGLPATPALAAGDYQQVLDITFPTDPRATFSDSYDACRDGCSRRHKAADLMGKRMWKEYAAVDGTICGIDEGTEDSWGRHLTLCGDDGRRYRYLHLNNDNPGTDDGQASLDLVYAPGIRRGVRVARGQFIAYMGDSGASETTAPHLHLDIFDDRVTDPYGDNRINPYPSLRAALARGDIPDGSAFYADPADRVAGSDRVGTAVALSQAAFTHADTVVVAPADTPHSTLVAGPLASTLDAPVLTMFPGRLDDRVVAEIRRLEARHVIIVGWVALPPATFEQAGVSADRVEVIDGGNRYATAALVAERIWREQGAVPAPTTPSPTTHEGLTAAPAPSTLDAPTLVVWDNARREDTRLLDGATTTVDLHIALEGVNPRRVDKVRFYLDGSDERFHVERHYPYDLAGTGSGGTSGRLDIERLGPGSHSVQAVVVLEDGERQRVSATFTVAGAVAAPVTEGARRAVVALGDHADPSRSWPDALMASWYGSARQMPVLLVSPAGLTAPTAGALDGVAEVVVAGGEAAVPRGHLAEIDRLAGTVTRRSGRTRYSTATAIADDVVRRRLADPSRLWAATGTNWPDALSAGPAVAVDRGVLVLVDGTASGGDRETADFLATYRERAERGQVIGGPAAVSDRALRNLRLYIT